MQFGQCLAAAEWCLKPRVWALAWGGESLSAMLSSAGGILQFSVFVG